MNPTDFLRQMLDSGARPFECQDCGVVHWLSEKDRLTIENAALATVTESDSGTSVESSEREGGE